MFQFNYPIVEELYKCDFFIENDILEEILALGDKVVPDLVGILDDLVKSPQNHTQQKEWYEAFYVSHSFYLLLELKAQKALKHILEVAKLSGTDLDFLFGDGLYDDFAEAIIKLGYQEVDTLLDFVRSSHTSLAQKDLLNKGIAQLALFYPEHRSKIIAAYRNHLQYFVQHKDKINNLFPYNEYDSFSIKADNYLALLVGILLDIEASELESDILKCYHLGLVDEDVLAVEDVIFEENQIDFPESIFDRYEDFRSSELAETSPYNPEAEELARQRAKYIKDEEEEKPWKSNPKENVEPIKKKKIFRE